MKIWKCPTCNSGVRAPEKLAKLDTRRWCLKCSARTGKLVERGMPSKATAKQRRDEARKTQTAKRQARRAIAVDAAKVRIAELAASFDRKVEDAADWLRAWAPRVVKLATFREAFRENYIETTKTFAMRMGLPGALAHLRRERKWNPSITIRRGCHEIILNLTPEQYEVHRQKYGARTRRDPHTWRYQPHDGLFNVYNGRWYASGTAYMLEHRLVVTTGASAADDLAVLVHELAHLAAAPDANHGPAFRELQRRAIIELTGEAPPVSRLREVQDGATVIQAWLNRRAP